MSKDIGEYCGTGNEKGEEKQERQIPPNKSYSSIFRRTPIR